MTLNDYLQATQRLLREKRQDLLSVSDLTSFVNDARREVALRTNCIRVLTPISGPVVSASITAGGSGYHAATTTATVTAPDFPSGTGANPNGAQATATPVVQGGVVTNVYITYGGDGYFQPQITIADSNATPGTGATVTAIAPGLNVLNQGQEVYPFSGINLTRNPGVKSVFAVQGVSIIYANYRYSLPVYSFSVYQAQIRQYPFQYQYVPTFASQYGRGVAGSFYVFPLPSQTYQYELDCYALPQDLVTDLSVEAIPDPYTSAIKYFACHLGMLSIQNYNVAQYYEQLFQRELNIYSGAANVSRVVNPYGRY